MAFKHGEQILSIGWFLDPAKTIKLLGIKTKLVDADWLPLKKFSWGELGYDYEEGLRFYVKAKQAEKAVEYIKTFHSKYNVSLKGRTSVSLLIHENRPMSCFVMGGSEFEKMEKTIRPRLLELGLTPRARFKGDDNLEIS